jgi:hypothetical protein
MMPARKFMGPIIENHPGFTETKEGNETTFQTNRHFIRYFHKSFDSAVLPPV